MAKCVPFIDLFSFQDVPIAWDFPVIINSHELGCVIFLFPAQTLKNGGNVLIPCYPTGVLYDLLECLKAYLDSASLSHVPVYFISPVAKSSLSFSNIFAEWLCDAKKAKVYQPEQPFLHAEFIKSGRLRHFPNIHGELGSVYQTPCVVFTGHPSLRCGDAVHFMEAWGDSSKNAVIFTEPDFEYLHALAPYQPLNMKAYYFPIDPRLNFFVANKLLNDFAPSCLVTAESYLPSAAHSQKENTCLQPEMQYYGLTRGRAVSIPLDGRFQQVMLDPELATKLLPQEILPGVSATTVSGLLSSRNNKHTLQPHPPHQRPHVSKLLWGELSADAVVQALREHGIVDVVVEGSDESKTLNIMNGKATMQLSSSRTTIRDCMDDKLRSILKDIVFRQLIQL
jgi:integrator complex subunit 9